MTVIPRSLRWLFTWSKFAVPRQTLLVLLFSRKEVTQPRRLCNEPFVSRGTILILKPQSRVLAYHTNQSLGHCPTSSHPNVELSCHPIIHYITIFYCDQINGFILQMPNSLRRKRAVVCYWNKSQRIDIWWRWFRNAKLFQVETMMLKGTPLDGIDC